MSRTPVVLDCDPGHDDAFAILLAAAHPDLDLLAITTVSGNGPVDKVTLNARRVCTLAGIDVVVAEGAERPLAGDAHGAEDIHGESALDGADLPEPTVALSPLPAVEQLVETIGASDQPVTIVATAPLTNVATLIRDHPETLANVSGISLMGGSALRGNVTPAAEFNIWADPEAAAIVFGSGLPLKMVGLDVTHTVLATPDVLDRFRATDTDLGWIGADLLTFYADSYRTKFGMPGAPLHDPLAVLAVVHPDWLVWHHCRVDIELDGRHTRGMTVVDLDGVVDTPPNVEVARAVDVGRFWDLMVDSVRRLGDPG
ncbi:nucleoside hydrolase [Jatrophihabitans sp. YIM 134969]